MRTAYVVVLVASLCFVVGCSSTSPKVGSPKAVSVSSSKAKVVHAPELIRVKYRNRNVE